MQTITITVCDKDGSVLGRLPVRVDLVPVGEWARFCALRGGIYSPQATAGAPVYEPVWHPEHGEPVLSTLRARFTQNGDSADCTGAGPAFELPKRYFQALAQTLSPLFVKQGLLKKGEEFRYFFTAVGKDKPSGKENPSKGRDDPQAAGKSGADFTVEAEVPDLRIEAADLQALREGAEPSGDLSTEEDFPVFIPRPVLDELRSLTEAAGTNETGGVLLGRLNRDPRTSEIFARVTAQIPARHARSEVTSLTFTAETWAAMRTAAASRSEDDLWLGWWHSHSFMHAFCKDCTHKEKGDCKADAAFMSQDDCTFHRTCFPAAHSLALVVSNSPCAGLTWNLFGWRDAVIGPRGFYIERRT